jgi:2,3-bisphosphoglycerate-independent phosphoglycerate mutase
MTTTSPTLLCILDGFGLNPRQEANAVTLAKKPNFDELWNNNPHTTLITYGEDVGLPEGQMGNSEVGHMNIGAGRVVEQWLLKISRALKTGSASNTPAFRSFLANIQKSPRLHVLGLFSDGGVHSHQNHLLELLPILNEHYTGTIALHLITDGRDTAPESAASVLSKFEEDIRSYERVKIASVCGRFHAMDRDNRWERTKKAYDLYCHSKGAAAGSASAWVTSQYASGITDEFVEPAVIHQLEYQDGDAVLFFNFRADRMRQLVASLCISAFTGFERTKPIAQPHHTLCFTRYSEDFPLPYLFQQEEITNHLGEVVASHKLNQFRLAETEKYPHVTYFLNGGKEESYPGEVRKVVPSPRDVKTYDLKPEMSAYSVAEEALAAIESKEYSLIVINFANCDMVGHTGDLGAAIKAVEAVDVCLGKIIHALEQVDGQALIIADHGNAELMVNYDTGEPHTAHTLYPVPCILYRSNGNSQAIQLKEGGALCDVAPTILEIMDIKKPMEMTGTSLIAINR